MSRFETAKDAIDAALAECGINPPQDPFTSQDDAVRQITVLLTSAGRQLNKLYDWQSQQKEHVIVTAENDTGKYDLPDDFGRMMDQTGWSRDQRVPLPGSVNAQTWQYLKGRNLVSSTIYMVFRNVENQFWVYPQPPDAPVPYPLTLAFEYMSRNWVVEAATVGTQNPVYTDKVTASGDLILFDPILISRFLKLRFREARGMESQGAQNEFLQMFAQATGQDVAGDNLNVANMSQPYPYLDMWRNTPDSGYGAG